MSIVLENRVWETTHTTGTGPVTLLGAKNGYQSFSVIGDNNSTHYCITDGVRWEIGTGTYSAGTLSRDQVEDSSSGGGRVDFRGGVKEVFCTPTTGSTAILDRGNTFTQPQIFSGINPALVPLSIVGATSQSSNITEWRDSNSSLLACINSTGRLGVGTATPEQQIEAAFNGGGGIMISSFRNSPLGGNLTIRHWRGTKASPQILQVGDYAGNIYFDAIESDGVEQICANISAQYRGDNAGMLRLSVNRSPDEFMRLGNNGGNAPGAVGIGLGAMDIWPQAMLHVKSTYGTFVPAKFRAALGQTGNLTEWQAAGLGINTNAPDGDVLASVSPEGWFSVGPTLGSDLKQHINAQFNGGGGFTLRSARNSTLGANITISHCRGTIASPLPLNAGDQVGNIYFQGIYSDGTEKLCANISGAYLGDNKGAIYLNVNQTPDVIATIAGWGADIAPGGMQIGGGTAVPKAKLHIINNWPTFQPVIIQGYNSQAANLTEWQDVNSNVLCSISENGYHTTRKNTAPADSELVAGEAAFWFDSTNGAAKFMIKAKQADGTVRTGSVSLS
jgi:hypothetical protein